MYNSVYYAIKSHKENKIGTNYCGIFKNRNLSLFFFLK